MYFIILFIITIYFLITLTNVSTCKFLYGFLFLFFSFPTYFLNKLFESRIYPNPKTERKKNYKWQSTLEAFVVAYSGADPLWVRVTSFIEVNFNLINIYKY